MHALTIKTDGSLWAWGWNGFGALGDGTFTDSSIPVKVMDDVKSVSAGGLHSLALKTDGSLWGWGHFGMYFPTPQQFLFVDDDVASVTAGGAHHLIIKTDGSLWAWGQFI